MLINPFQPSPIDKKVINVAQEFMPYIVALIPYIVIFIRYIVILIPYIII